MRKCLIGLLVISLNMCMLSGCKKQTLPVPEYPVDTASVAAALQEAQLAWKIEEMEAWLDDQSVFALHHDEELVASFVNGKKDGERVLNIAFSGSFANAHLRSPEEWEKAFRFATHLYGGFENADQVYLQFASDFDTKNTVSKNAERIMGGRAGYEEISRWQSEIDGVHCRVVVLRPYLTGSDRYLGAILLTSDIETFFTPAPDPTPASNAD